MALNTHHHSTCAPEPQRRRAEVLGFPRLRGAAGASACTRQRGTRQGRGIPILRGPPSLAVYLQDSPSPLPTSPPPPSAHHTILNKISSHGLLSAAHAPYVFALGLF